MISGVPVLRKSTLYALILLFSATVHGEESNIHDDFSILASELAKISYSHAAFVEKKELAALNSPLILNGKLEYRANDYLVKQTLTPFAETYKIKGDLLIHEREHEDTITLDLNEYPALRGLFEAFRLTLAGDIKSLEKYYKIHFFNADQNSDYKSGDKQQWILSLIPLNDELADYVTRIKIQGRGTQIISIETIEPNGDKSLMTLMTAND